MLYDDFQPVPASHITIAEHSAVIAESKIKSECALEEKLSIFLVFSVCCTVTLTKSFPPSSCQCKNQSTELEKKKKNVPFLVQIVSTAVCLCVTTLSSLSRSSHTHTHTWLGKKKNVTVCVRGRVSEPIQKPGVYIRPRLPLVKSQASRSVLQPTGCE